MQLTRRTIMGCGALLAAAGRFAGVAAAATDRKVTDRVAALLPRMTLDEKVGQLSQMAGGRQKALNSRIDAAALDLVRRGGVGSYLHVAGAGALTRLQKVAVEESRLGIPLLFAMDVVHGFRTLYPVPLAIAASWDPETARATARMAAVETAVSGLHWTFAPMVDVARDPRWGRVVEGAGEDPHLGAAMAVAQVRGFQTDDLTGQDAVIACAKHFGAYGAAAGGRDYDSADVSERTLHEVYLPPFHAAARAGAASFMVAFNDVGGVPATANADLLRTLLRDRWDWDGMTVSDWNAVVELVNHGVAADQTDATAVALKAGVDMDMASGAYSRNLAAAVRAEPALQPLLDAAVGHVLTAKARLGLFDTPFRFGDATRERTVIASAPHRAVARRAAERSIVLLRNDGGILPLKRGAKIALIGALADDPQSAMGSWRARGVPEDVVTLRTALGTRATFHPGTGAKHDDAAGIAGAAAVARDADVVVLALGEDYDLSGEARSRSSIALPGRQAELVAALKATGKPIVAVLMHGRPLALDDVLDGVPGVMASWFLGVESGPAIVGILDGTVDPGGRLPMGFPRTTGQLPMTYAHLPTGRPANPDLAVDSARYRDVAIGPLFPFGHGLGYARFDWSPLTLDRSTIGPDGSVRATLTVTNISDRSGDEVVQLYQRDPLSSVARPVLELRGFVRLTLKPGERRRITFVWSAAQAAMWTRDGWRVEAGRIELMAARSSADIVSRAALSISAAGPAAGPAAAIATPVEVGA